VQNYKQVLISIILLGIFSTPMMSDGVEIMGWLFTSEDTYCKMYTLVIERYEEEGLISTKYIVEIWAKEDPYCTSPNDMQLLIIKGNSPISDRDIGEHFFGMHREALMEDVEKVFKTIEKLGTCISLRPIDCIEFTAKLINYLWNEPSHYVGKDLYKLARKRINEIILKDRYVMDRKVLAYADFSDLPEGEVKSNCYDIEAFGCDNNPYYKHSIRFLYKGAKLICKFTLDEMPSQAFLVVEHLSSYSKGCPNEGYSPVTIILNDKIVVSNFSPASHKYTTDRWNVTELLKEGENEIVWEAADLCTHYWLKQWKIEGM